MMLPPVLGGARRRLFLRLVGNGVAQAAAAVLSALLVRTAFDGLSHPGGDLPVADVVGSGVALVAVAAAMVGLRVLERVDAERTAQDYIIELRDNLFDRAAGAVASLSRPRSHGPLMLRFASDLTAVRQWVGDGLARLIAAGVAASGAAAAIAYLDPWLALGVAAAFGVPAATALWLGPSFRAATAELRRRRGRLAATVSDRLLRARVLIAFGGIARERRRITKGGRRVADASVKRARLAGALRALPDFGSAIATGAVLVIGGYEILAGRATAGTLVAAIAVLGILTRPIRDLARTYEYWNSYQVARRKIVELMRLDRGRRHRPRSLPVDGSARLVFEQVDVAGALHRLSATAEPGSVVAVVGPSGAGKSTLLNVAGGLVEPEDGRVLLDGVDVAAATSASRRQAIGMLSTDLPLLSGSLRRNLSYRGPAAKPEEVARITALCGLDDYLASLPEGIDTRVGENGQGIPTGLRHRLALARALLPWPRLLLVDQPEALLDPPGRKALTAILARRDATVLIATSDLALARMADVIWYLEDGTLAESGEPHLLLARPSRAARFLGLPLRASAELVPPAVELSA